MNPVAIFGAAFGGPNGPFTVFKLLEALAPALVQDKFVAVPGGLRLTDAKIDVILDPMAAGFAAISNPAIDYLARTGFSLLRFEDSSAGLFASLAIDTGNDLIYYSKLRPWFSLTQGDLVLVHEAEHNGDDWLEAICVSADRPLQRLNMLFTTHDELQHGFEEAETLASIWREVIWLGGAL